MSENTDDGLSYHPNMQKPQEGGGAACFLNQERVCGPDCMAFLIKPPEGRAYLGEQWAHCHLLVNADRTGRHLSIIATILGETAATAKRTAGAPKAG